MIVTALLNAANITTVAWTMMTYVPVQEEVEEVALADATPHWIPVNHVNATLLVRTTETAAQTIKQSAIILDLQTSLPLRSVVRLFSRPSYAVLLNCYFSVFFLSLC